MATTTLTSVTELMKEVYEPRVRDQLQSETIALKRLEQTSEGVESRTGGKYVRFATRVKRNHGIGARAENTALPAAQSQKYQDAQVKLAYLYGSIELTGQTMELADKDFQAFASALDGEVSGLKENLSKDMNRQAYGTSTGILATATAAGSTTTFVTTDAGAQYLEEGMIVDFWDTSAGALDANAGTTGFTITALASAGGNTTATFTPAASAATASGDTLHRFGARGLETIGLQQIVSDSGVLYNIDPATVGVWKSVVDANGGVNRALSEGLMIQMIDKIRQKGGKTTLMLTSLGVRRAYFNLLVQQRRYQGTTEFAGGFKGLAFATDNGDVPLVSDFDCQPNRIYYLNEKELTFYAPHDWSWMDRDGSMWNRKVTSAGTFDAYTALMYKYVQLGCHRRNSQGLLSDITEA